MVASLAATAIGLTLAARAVLPAPQPPDIVPPPASIVFEPATLEMGELQPEVAKTLVVRLRNVTDHALTVSAAVASCGCTTSTWPPEPIAPGASGEAAVTVKPPATQGESLMKTVTYMVDGVGPVTLTVLGHVAKVPPVAAPATPAPAVAPAPASPAGPTAARRAPTFVRVNPPIQPGAHIAFPDLQTFVRGPTRRAFEPGKVYVFDFFNTTCSHCKEFAPLVTRLAREFGAKGMEFIAITDEQPDAVQKWLALPGKADEVTYSVAADPDRSALMELQNGTFRSFNPRFFVAKDGVVLWFGHPKEAEGPLKEILAGTWDPETVRAAAVTESQVARAKNLLDSVARECEKDGDWQRMLATIDAVRAAIPERASQYDSQRFVVMIGLARQEEAGYAFGHRIATEHAQDMPAIRSLARAILQSPYVEHRDLDFGMELAVAADTLAKGEDARAADTLALAWFSKGDRAKAVEHGERALRLEKDPKARRQYETALQKYRTGTPGPEPTKPRPVPGSSPSGGSPAASGAPAPTSGGPAPE